MSKLSQQIGADIKARREELGLSFGVLSDRSGVGKSVIHRIERGENAEIKTLAKICEALEGNLSLGFVPLREEAA